MFVRVVIVELVERLIPCPLSSPASPEIVPSFVRVVIVEVIRRIPFPESSPASPEIVPVFVRVVIVEFV